MVIPRGMIFVAVLLMQDLVAGCGMSKESTQPDESQCVRRSVQEVPNFVPAPEELPGAVAESRDDEHVPAQEVVDTGSSLASLSSVIVEPSYDELISRYNMEELLVFIVDSISPVWVRESLSQGERTGIVFHHYKEIKRAIPLVKSVCIQEAFFRATGFRFKRYDESDEDRFAGSTVYTVENSCGRRVKYTVYLPRKKQGA